MRRLKEFNRALAIDPAIFDPRPAGGVSLKLASVGDRAYFHYTMAKMYGSRGDVEHCRQYLTKASEEGYPYVRDALKDNGFGGGTQRPGILRPFVRSLRARAADSFCRIIVNRQFHGNLFCRNAF